MLPASPRTGRRSASTRTPAPTVYSRSSSQSRPKYHQDDLGYTPNRVDQRAASRQIRPQRSVGNLPSNRMRNNEGPPPVPSLPRQKQPSAYNRVPTARPALPSNRESNSSTSSSGSSGSSGSSFLDRMRQRNPGSTSSQTSFEVEQDEDYKAKERRGVGGSLTQDIPNDDKESSALAYKDQALNDYASYGYSIWSRITAATSGWTWTKTDSDAMTSAPGDSELTRILKSYHISKARDRSDLPDWLFTEQERKPVRNYGSGEDRRQHAWETASDAGVYTASRGRGFRDIYDSIDTDSHGRDTSTQRRLEVASTSKATDRLKAIRDAKRQAATPPRESNNGPPAAIYNRDPIDRHRRAASSDPSSGRRGTSAIEVPNRQPSQRPGRGLPRNPRGG